MVKNLFADISPFSYSALKTTIAQYSSIFPQTCRFLQLLLVTPATSAMAERSFSCLRHVKTYLRTTMKQDRLNHLMTIYIHKDRVIDIEEAMDVFILFNSEHMQIFGKPKQN